MIVHEGDTPSALAKRRRLDHSYARAGRGPAKPGSSRGSNFFVRGDNLLAFLEGQGKVAPLPESDK